ncbi:tyrosine-type recombinase/integrase [Nocardia abscessus]|uniref:tyrosine-type recombinase/integrase n=1 Tax=Nocardia abscessus TaxID=120957 RepID=UPI00245417F1|nr:tyrosine-type recombinase/integrase [Nocardia abscessus]
MEEHEAALLVARTSGLVVRRIGAVVDDPNPELPWRVVGPDGMVVPEAAEYLRHSVASGFSASSVESYARALLRWLRFLWAVDMAWDRADRAEVRDFVLWMRTTEKDRSRRPESPEPGSVNPRTGKRLLTAKYAPATINHNLAVISGFYDYFLAEGRGPLRNPVPLRTSRRNERADAHHNPMEPFRPRHRGGYRQRVPRTEPRAIPDRLFDELFELMPSNRDRALMALYVSTAARPTELVNLAQARVDYGEQLVGVIRKGTNELQWLPASPDAFVWLRLYQSELPPELAGADKPLWWTLRRPWRALNYEAMRAVLRRANIVLGTNWTLHDLRHTAALRMAADPGMLLVDIQVLLGHAHLSTTERYLRLRLEQLVEHVRQHHRRRAELPVTPERQALGYDAADMRELVGWQQGAVG